MFKKALPCSDYTALILSLAECEQILDNMGTLKQHQLKGYCLKKLTNTGGHLGEYYKLIMEVAFPAKNFGKSDVDILEFFVKRMPEQNSEAEIKYIFQKEASLYAKLLKDLQNLSKTKWLPTAYYIRDDLIVLEDLMLSDYHMQREYLDPEFQMKQVLRGLAAMHAASIAYEERETVKIGSVFGEWLREITISPKIAWWKTGMAALTAVIEAHPDYQSEEARDFIKNKLQKRLAQIYTMASLSARYCNVLTQRDAWAANVFLPSVQNRSNTAIIIDYQTARYCPPAIDVLLANYMNLPLEVLKKEEPDLLDTYYSAFESELLDHDIRADNHMTYEELVDSYKEFRLVGCVYNALACTVIRVPAEFMTDEYKQVNRKDKVLEYMGENEEFRKQMNDCVTEIMNIIMRKK